MTDRTNTAGRILTALGATGLVAAPVAGFAGPAWAYGPTGHPASITVTVSDGPNGIVDVTVSGSLFSCNETVDVSITDPTESIGTATATCGTGSANGTFDTTFQLPAGVPAGHHTLNAVGATSGDTASAGFTTTEGSQPQQPCTTAVPSGPGAGSAVVLAAAVEVSCVNQAPGLSSSGGSPPAGSLVAGSPKLGGSVGTGSGSQLPLTGADVTGITAAGAALVLTGGLMVSASRRRRVRRFDRVG